MEQAPEAPPPPPLPASGAVVFTQPPPPPPSQQAPVYASFFKRLVAYIVDNILVFIVVAMAFVIVIPGFADTDNSEGMLTLFWLTFIFYNVVFLGYFTISVGTAGQTLGKYFMGIEVLTTGGELPGFGRAFIRSIGYYFSGFIFYLGFFIALFDSRSQTLHDKLAGTVVVEIN